MVLLLGPTGWRFLVSEVALQGLGLKGSGLRVQDAGAHPKPYNLQGHLAHKEQHPSLDNPRALGIGLLQGPRERVFLMMEVPLYTLRP